MATFKNPVSIVKRAGGTAIIGEGTDYTLDTPANQPLNLTPMGDSYQQTYSGKNLLQNTGPDTDTTNGITFVKNSDGSVSATGTGGGGGAWYQVATTDLHAGEVLSGCPTGGGANTYSLQTGSYGGNLDPDYGSGVSVRNGTSVAIWIIIRSGQTVDNLTFYPQLEVAPSKTSYEPYVGGIPAPSPSYPQDIKVVTGQQSVTVSDGGGHTQTFTFDLAPLNAPIIELCRFGDYQDFLWTDGIKWYKHKELGKQTLVSSMFHEMHNLTAVDYAKIDKPTDYLAYDKYINVPVIASCAEYISRTSGDSLDNVKWLGKILSEPSKPYFYVGLDNGTTQAQAISLLEGSTIYYPLATFVEEEITDANLVSDLNTMKSALSYSPTTDVSSSTPGSDLPVIVGSAVITGV